MYCRKCMLYIPAAIYVCVVIKSALPFLAFPASSCPTQQIILRHHTTQWTQLHCLRGEGWVFVRVWGGQPAAGTDIVSTSYFFFFFNFFVEGIRYVKINLLYIICVFQPYLVYLKTLNIYARDLCLTITFQSQHGTSVKLPLSAQICYCCL